MLLVSSTIIAVGDYEISPFFFSDHPIMGMGKEWSVANAVVTAPTILRLNNHHTISMGNRRIVFGWQAQKDTQLENLESLPDKLTYLVRSYFKHLQGVEYTAFGINFRVVIVPSNLELMDEFLSKNSSLGEMKYIVSFDPFTMNNTLTKAYPESNESAPLGVIFNANFHCNLEDIEVGMRLDFCRDILNERESCFDRLKEELNEINLA